MYQRLARCPPEPKDFLESYIEYNPIIMASLGLPQGFEVFHDVKDCDDLDDMSLGSVGEMSILTMNTMDHDHDDQQKDDEDNDNKDDDEDMSAKHEDDHQEGDPKREDVAEPQPHMVSADSMATIKHGNVNQPPPKRSFLSGQTPYDSLKDLVKSKKRQLTGRPGLPESTSNGMVSRPSTFLRQALYGSHQPAQQANQDFDQPNKRPKVEEHEVTNPLLHKACMRRGAEAEVIQALLKIDQNLAGKAHQIIQAKDVYDCVSYKFKASKTKEKYSYPLNIAIRNHVKPAAIELLVRAAPHVAAFSDGNMKECSLSILLKNNPHDAELADLLLLSNPSCVKTRDKNQNTPLHVACQYGVSLAIVKHICILYPQSLRIRNRFGYTPLEVAQRSNRSNHIATYLLGKQRGIF